MAAARRTRHRLAGGRRMTAGGGAGGRQRRGAMKRRWLGTGEDMGFGVTLGWLSRQRFVTAAIAAMLVANGCGKEDPPWSGWWSQDNGGGQAGELAAGTSEPQAGVGWVDT